MEKSRKKNAVKEEPKKNCRRKRRNTSKYRTAVLAVSVIALAIVTGAAAWVSVYGFPAPIQARIDIRPDADAQSGTLYAGERHEVGVGDFWVIINQLPTMEEGSLDCNINYENPAENHYSARISLYSKEDGKLLGNTRRVAPGNYVETIRLKREVKPGEYPVTARIELFEEKTPVTELSMEITLRVLGRTCKTGRETRRQGR